MSSVLDEYAIAPSIREFIARRHGMLIDGQWRGAVSGERLEVFEPSSAERIATIAAGSADDANLAVEAAHRSTEDGRWSRQAPAYRERILLKLADLIEANLEE